MRKTEIILDTSKLLGWSKSAVAIAEADITKAGVTKVGGVKPTFGLTMTGGVKPATRSMVGGVKPNNLSMVGGVKPQISID